MPPIEPQNLTAQLTYRAAGNPPSSRPSSAIANCFPGLEFDFRNIWKNLLVSVELHESNNIVFSLSPGGLAEQAGVAARDTLISIDGRLVSTDVTGPSDQSGTGTLAIGANLEWTNALSDFLLRQGEDVLCVFQSRAIGALIPVMLKIRPLFQDGVLLEKHVDGEFEGDVAVAGALTSGLCSPWQADFRECGCYYWAASRPDFVNTESSETTVDGDNWMQKQRSPAGSKSYVTDNPNNSDQWGYQDLYRDWEQLQIQQGGRDKPE